VERKAGGEIQQGFEMRYYVYALHNPNSARIRYIGMSVDAVRRYASHIRSARKGATLKVSRWIASVLNESHKKPLLSILHSCDSLKEAKRLEILEIKRTPDLVNVQRDQTRTNIHFHERQRIAMHAIAKSKGTTAAVEYREAVDNHVTANKRLLESGLRRRKKGLAK
jgi:predicted GIY-YIG superfamily endonuclease